MKNIVTVFVFLALLVPSTVHAQEPNPYIIRVTKPLDTDVRNSLDAWLLTDAPSDAPYYIVTYHRNIRVGETRVSLVGVDLPSPESEWSLTEDPAVWMGTVTVLEDGTVLSDDHDQLTQKRSSGLAMLKNAAGGGSYVMFPFESGMSMLFGPKGVHNAGFGTSGLVAVDLVSGDDMGVSAAGPYAYAADTGTVDYVCEDDIQVAIRTYNETTGDYFLYAHLLANANLVDEHEFTQGEYLGNLKYGTFDDTCGYADQAAKHYHIHFAFHPSGGTYQIGSCILNVSSAVWACGDENIKTGGWLAGGGGFTIPGEDGQGGTVVTDPTFFDYILTGFLGMIQRSYFDKLPSHEPFEFTYVILGVMQTLFKLVYVFFYSVVDLQWFVRALMLGLAIKTVFGIAWVVSFLFKAWKSLVPIIGA